MASRLCGVEKALGSGNPSGVVLPVGLFVAVKVINSQLLEGMQIMVCFISNSR